MTTVMDLDTAPALAAVRRRPPWPWLVAVLVAGLLGGTVASVAGAGRTSEPSGLTREVAFVVEGDGRASYAAIVTTVVEPVASTTTHHVTGSATVVLAIIATGRATCRVVVDGAVVVEETADHGPATCVAALP